MRQEEDRQPDEAVLAANSHLDLESMELAELGPCLQMQHHLEALVQAGWESGRRSMRETQGTSRLWTCEPGG